VECAERHLNPLTTNLVVADESRTDKTICLAVSPSLKAWGVPGRPRLFEVIQKMRQVNRKRLLDGIREGKIGYNKKTGKRDFSSVSFDAEAIAADPTLQVGYIIAPPRMRLYEEYSSRIYATYLKYVSPEDIVVYSIDEVFIDLTPYLKTYGMTARELTMAMIRDVLYNTGITATAGIGTNLYLAKVAMDIVAKKAPPDKDGVRIAELNERTYREKLWTHRPLTDFWRIGPGITRRLERMYLFTMGDVARASLDPMEEKQLYKAFGVNAELIIDHAWGWEPVTIDIIHGYRPQTSSLSSGQVLSRPYKYEEGRLIVREMIELQALDLVKKGYVTKQMVLHISFDRASLDGEFGRQYRGPLARDHYGRLVPAHAHGTANLDHYTASAKTISKAVLKLYEEIVDPDLLIRRVNITASNMIPETEIPPPAPRQLDMFTDDAEIRAREAKERAEEEKEKKLQKVTIKLQEKYGKNIMLKGMNLLEGGTTIERNSQIGGHRAGED